jgi:peptide/nickel transport system ATP-binding protein
VRQLCREHGVAALYVTHDIAVVAAIAQRVAVVYAGRIVEIGPTARVLQDPAHPYTRALIRAVPDLGAGVRVSGIPGQAPESGADDRRCAFAARCALAHEACIASVPALVAVAPAHEARCLRCDTRESVPPREPAPDARSERPPPLLVTQSVRAFYGRREALHGVSFAIGAGECVALVGESGSGKTTLARCLAGLQGEVDGSLIFDGEPLPLAAGARSASARRRIQYIFQNPYQSFNPRRSIGTSLATTVAHFERSNEVEQRRKVLAALERVALPASIAERYPRDLSGGQRQRAAIARALITEPELLICDEITSALDVSVQAVITELLAELQRERGVALLFVTHNLALVRGISQRVCVMQSGRLIEEGPTEDVMQRPQAAETQRLLRDSPRFAVSTFTPAVCS